MSRCFVNEKEKERLLDIKPKYLLSSEVYDPDTTDYLTITSLEGDNVLTLKKSNYHLAINELYYTTEENKLDWKKIEWSNYGTEYKINFSKSVYLYGENPNGISNQNYYLQLRCSRKFECSGNIMTLIQKDGNVNTIPNDYCFRDMFSNSSIVKASNLKLSAETLKKNCYLNMFSGCSHLISAPRIDGIELADYCCSNMFNGCTLLTTAPSLPATTLAQYCYTEMFMNCISLTTISAFPATDLGVGCYKSMFYGCSNLTTMPELPATVMVNNCYQSMFRNCTSLSVISELSATSLANSCYYEMFRGCTSLTTPPELSADSLANNCYQGMFQGCTNLMTAPELPATTLWANCYDAMFSGCTSLTTAPALPATTLVPYCYRSMFQDCIALTTAPALPATTLVNSCYISMFKGCVSLTAAPELPATTLVSYCYKEMFRGCSSLNYIKCLATSIDANNSTTNWVQNVNSTGTFDPDPNSSWSIGNNGIPSGWTVFIPDNTVENVTETLIFTAKQENSVIKISSIAFENKFYFSYDLTNWYKVLQGVAIPLEDINDVVHIIGERGEQPYTTSTYDHFSISGDVAVSGSSKAFNNYKDLTKPAIKFHFYNLFSGCSISDASGLDLSYSTQTEQCFELMFAGSSITDSGLPTLPTPTAVTVFRYMFKDCQNLVNIPTNYLSNTQLTDNCYYGMFRDCENLQTPPELPATTLKDGCYQEMFYGCSKLATIPQLSATTLKTNCYRTMFQYCTTITEADISATTLENYCLAFMFYGCGSLNKITTHFSTIGTGSLVDWVLGVAATGNFYNLGGYTFSSGNSGIPSGWTEHTTLPE